MHNFHPLEVVDHGTARGPGTKGRGLIFFDMTDFARLVPASGDKIVYVIRIHKVKCHRVYFICNYVKFWVTAILDFAIW